MKVINFLTFRDFSELILRFLMIKTIKIKAKMGLFLRGTRARPRGSAMRAHAVPTRRDVTCALFIFIVSIWVIVHISI